jgi:hypothetical protein
MLLQLMTITIQTLTKSFQRVAPTVLPMLTMDMEQYSRFSSSKKVTANMQNLMMRRKAKIRKSKKEVLLIQVDLERP